MTTHPTGTDPLADLLVGHWPAQSYTHNICTCGKHTTHRDDGFGAWAAHVASVLRAAGYTNGQATDRDALARTMRMTDSTDPVQQERLGRWWDEGLCSPDVAAQAYMRADAVLALHPDPTPAACQWCGGTGGEHDGAIHDAVAATGTPAYFRPHPTPDDTTDPRAALAALAATLTARTDERDQARAEVERLRAGIEQVRALWLRWEQEFTGAGPWHDVIQNEIVAPLRDATDRALLADDLRTQHPKTTDYADQPAPVADEPGMCSRCQYVHRASASCASVWERPAPVADVTFDNPIRVAGRPAGERKGGEAP